MKKLHLNDIKDVFHFFLACKLSELGFFFSGTCLSRCIIMRGARVKPHSWVQNSIIGWRSTVGKWVGALGMI